MTLKVSTSARSQGFTLINLLVVTGIFSVAVTLLGPGLRLALMRANEGAALAAVRNMFIGATLYEKGKSKYPGSISDLVSEGLLDSEYGDGEHSGYEFSLKATAGGGIEIHGSPVRVNYTGRFYFFGDETGVTRWSLTGLADASSLPIGDPFPPINYRASSGIDWKPDDVEVFDGELSVVLERVSEHLASIVPNTYHEEVQEHKSALMEQDFLLAAARLLDTDQDDIVTFDELRSFGFEDLPSVVGEIAPEPLSDAELGVDLNQFQVFFEDYLDQLTSESGIEESLSVLRGIDELEGVENVEDLEDLGSVVIFRLPSSDKELEVLAESIDQALMGD